MPDSLIEREFLPLRARLLDVAATLDRLEREGDSSHGYAEQVQSIEAALRLLLEGGNRAERMQLLFSLPYDEAWKTNLKVSEAASMEDGEHRPVAEIQDLAEDVGQ